MIYIVYLKTPITLANAQECRAIISDDISQNSQNRAVVQLNFDGYIDVEFTNIVTLESDTGLAFFTGGVDGIIDSRPAGV